MQIRIKHPIEAHPVIGMSPDSIEYYYEDDGKNVPESQECIRGLSPTAYTSHPEDWHLLTLPEDTVVAIGGESIGHIYCPIKDCESTLSRWSKAVDCPESVDEVFIPIHALPQQEALAAVRRMRQKKQYMLQHEIYMGYWEQVTQGDVEQDAPLNDDILFSRMVRTNS